MRSSTHTLGVLLLAATALVGDGDGDGRDERFSGDAHRVASARRAEIVAELITLGDHEWAGDYYQGEGLAVNCALRLAPRSGFVFEWHGCLGLYDRNYGPVSIEDGRVRLEFSFENIREGFRGIAPVLVPVAWGERRYLVPADDLVGFCNDVNSGSEPRTDIHGNYFLRRGDEEKPVTGWPEIPADHRAYLLSVPIDARVIEAGPPVPRSKILTRHVVRVTLDAGQRHGLLPGMDLYVVDPEVFVQSIEIETVSEDSSSGVAVLWLESNPIPEVGWCVSTRAPWND